MKFLLIDTCGETASAAIADTSANAPLTAATLPGRSAAEKLISALRELTTKLNLDLHDLTAIAVVNGPGSFTGVRVGVSAAKGLAEGLDVPVVAISRLSVLAEAAHLDHATPAAALLDAGRGEFYCRMVPAGQPAQEALFTHAEVLSRTAGVRLICAEPAVAAAFAEFDPILLTGSLVEPTAAIARRRIAAAHFDDPATLDANYLRAPDAKATQTHATAPRTDAHPQ